jgi:hypothetical protein
MNALNPLRCNVENLRSWLHRIEEACCGPAAGSATREDIRSAALFALRGERCVKGPGLHRIMETKEDFPEEPQVVLRLTLREANSLQHGMADLLCWSAGFRSARTEDTSTHPMGTAEVRDMRDHLRRAIDLTEAKSK